MVCRAGCLELLSLGSCDPHQLAVSCFGREVGRDEEREAGADLVGLVEEFGFCLQGM